MVTFNVSTNLIISSMTLLRDILVGRSRDDPALWCFLCQDPEIDMVKIQIKLFD
jgi:hypothetical protein